MKESLRLLGPAASHDSARKYLGRYWGPAPCAIFPTTSSKKPVRNTSDYLYALDPKMIKIRLTLMKWFNENHKVDETGTGYAGPSGVASNASALSAMAGWPMRPTPIPLLNNTKFLASLGVAELIPAKYVPMLDEVCRLFFGSHRPETLRIRRDGSTGFPYFTTNVEHKKKAVMSIFDNVDDFLNLVTSDNPDDLLEALKRYHFVYLYAIFRRLQADSLNGDGTPKQRTAPTAAEARSGDYSGKTYADKTVRIDGHVIPDSFGMRARDVFGFNGPGNYFMTGVFGCWRSVYMERFAFTYKTRDREDKKAKTAGFAYSSGADVKTMDKTIPKDFFDRVCDNLAKYCDPRFAKFVRRALSAPYVVSDFDKDDESFEPLFGGSPFDPKSWTNNCVGLPSGIACNPDMGKLWMTFVYVCRLFDIGVLRAIRDIEPFLQGKNRDHALLDSSDDAVFLSNSSTAIQAWENHKSELAVIGPEHPTLYLGDVFTIDARGQRDVVPNIVTYMVNLLCREDSIDKKKIQVVANGYMARNQVYRSAPLFGEVNDMVRRTVRDVAGFNIDNIYGSLASRTRFTFEEAILQTKPQAVYYLLDLEKVHPDILDELLTSIQPELFYDKIAHLFKS